MDAQPVDQPHARRSARWFLGALGLVVLIGSAAYVSTLPLGGPAAASRSADATFYALGTAVEGVGIGQAAPDFVTGDDHKPLLMDLDGKPIRLADFAGKPLWIVFWATWCIPCQEEVSDIRASYHAHADDGLDVLAIDIQEPTVAVREYALSHDIDYTIGLDSTGAVKDLYGAWGLPSHLFLDGHGVIRDRYLGQLTRELMEEHLIAIIAS
jgi:peroxiredoxin